MDFDDTPDDAAFRREAHEWLSQHARPRTAGSRRGGVMATADPARELEHVRASQAWQATLADAGWAGIAWPEAFGGRGGTPRQQAIFDEEQARFDVPQSVFAQGIGMAG